MFLTNRKPLSANPGSRVRTLATTVVVGTAVAVALVPTTVEVVDGDTDDVVGPESAIAVVGATGPVGTVRTEGRGNDDFVTDPIVVGRPSTTSTVNPESVDASVATASPAAPDSSKISCSSDAAVVTVLRFTVVAVRRFVVVAVRRFVVVVTLRLPDADLVDADLVVAVPDGEVVAEGCVAFVVAPARVGMGGPNTLPLWPLAPFVPELSANTSTAQPSTTRRAVACVWSDAGQLPVRVESATCVGESRRADRFTTGSPRRLGPSLSLPT